MIWQPLESSCDWICRTLVFRWLLWTIGAGFAFNLQTFCSEIKKQARFDAGGREVIHQLHFVARCERLVGFQFQHHLCLNQDVRREVADLDAIVAYGDRLLKFDL